MFPIVQKGNVLYQIPLPLSSSFHNGKSSIFLCLLILDLIFSHGDLAQSLRERTINRLKTGKIDIVVATDVAARGLDVDRITHVVNYDSPYDTESYVHRIGRTGRAGRDGNAILFITPRERNLL